MNFDVPIKQRLLSKAALAGIPVLGAFELTPRCNFQCKMCYVRLTPEEMRPLGRERTAEQFIYRHTFRKLRQQGETALHKRRVPGVDSQLPEETAEGFGRGEPAQVVVLRLTEEKDRADGGPRLLRMPEEPL